MVYQYIKRDALYLSEPLIVTWLHKEFGRRAHTALCTTCDESFLLVPEMGECWGYELSNSPVTRWEHDYLNEW